MRKYLLTDFNTNRWKGIKLDSVEKCIYALNNKYNTIYGELGDVNKYDVSLSNASHVIENITYKNGEVYGYVRLLTTKHGKIAKTLGDNLTFNIRCIGISNPKTIILEQILTWDILEIDSMVEHRNDVINEILK